MLVSFSSNDSTALARRKAGQQWCYSALNAPIAQAKADDP